MNKFKAGDVVQVDDKILTIEHVYYSVFNHCYMYTFICYPFVFAESSLEEL